VTATDAAALPGPVRGSIALQFLERIGSGGFATVYRARQEGLDRLVAVKVLHESADPAARRRFLEESRILARMPPHPAIVGVYASMAAEGREHIVLELVSGGSLEERLASGPMGPRDVVAVGSWMAAALGSAHTYGVVHGDVKASNVLLTASGHPKLADFGAGVFGADQPVARTPGVSPPEILAGGHPSVRGDVYSLGRRLERCLGDAEASPGSAEVRALIARMVPEHPAARLASMDEVLEGLRAIEDRAGWPATPSVVLVAEGDTVDPDGTGSPPTIDDVPIRRSRRPWAVAIAVLAAAVFVAGFVSGRGADRPASTAERGVAPSVPTTLETWRLQGIGPYTVLHFTAEPSLALRPGPTASQRLATMRDGLQSAFGAVPVPTELSAVQQLDIPEHAGRIELQAFNTAHPADCVGIRTGEIGLVDSKEGVWVVPQTARPPLLVEAWVTRMADTPGAHAIFTMHAMHAGPSGDQCDGGADGLVDPRRIDVRRSDLPMPALGDVDESVVFHTTPEAGSLAIAARRGSTVVALAVAGIGAGPDRAQLDELGRTLSAALAS
jgi:hypothetical protein